MSVLSMLSELLERGLEVVRNGLILLQLFALGVDDALGRLGDELGVVQFGLHAADFVLRTGKLAGQTGALLLDVNHLSHWDIQRCDVGDNANGVFNRLILADYGDVGRGREL